MRAAAATLSTLHPPHRLPLPCPQRPTSRRRWRRTSSPSAASCWASSLSPPAPAWTSGVCVRACLSVCQPSPAQPSPLRTPHSLTRPASHPRPPVQPAGAAVAAGAGAAGGPAGGQDHHHLAAGPPVWADPRRVCAHRLCAQPGWRVCVCAAGAGQPAQRAARRPQPPPHHCRGTVHGPHAAPHRRGRSHRQSAQPAWRRRCARWARGHAGHMGGLHGIDALAALHALAALQRARHHSIPPFLPPRPPTRPP